MILTIEIFRFYNFLYIVLLYFFTLFLYIVPLYFLYSYTILFETLNLSKTICDNLFNIFKYVYVNFPLSENIYFLEMLSIFCNTSLLRRPLVSVHVMESLAQCGAQERRHVSTSATSFNSGRFRKIKPVTASFLSRSSVKQIKETSNPAFGREFLDKTVEKLLQGKPKYKSSYIY